MCDKIQYRVKTISAIRPKYQFLVNENEEEEKFKAWIQNSFKSYK